MGLSSIGGQGGNGAYGEISALEKFQAIRDLAKKRIEGTDTRTRLIETIKEKQVELKAGSNLPVPAAYGRAGIIEKRDPRPSLGQFVDFLA